HQYRLVVLRAHHETLEVQDDLGNVLLDAGHGGELVLNTLDADAGHGSTGNRRQQGAAQRGPDGVAEARLQGFMDELGAELGDRLFGQGGTLSDQHGPFLPISPTAARYMTATGRPRGLRDHYLASAGPPLRPVLRGGGGVWNANQTRRRFGG